MLGWLPPEPPLVSLPTYLRVLGYLVFLLVSGLTIRYRDVDLLRRGVVVGLLVAFLAANLLGTAVLPAVHMYKYTRPLDRTASHYELYAVDSDGDELRLDGNLLQPAERETFARRMAGKYADFNRYVAAKRLLAEIRAYRRTIESGPHPMRILSFPNPALMDRWSPQELRSYDRFVGIHVYRYTQEFGDGRTVKDRRHELVASFHVGNTTRGPDRIHADSPSRRDGNRITPHASPG